MALEVAIGRRCPVGHRPRFDDEARVLALLDTAPASLLEEHPELARWHAQRRVDAVHAWHRWA